MCCSLDFERRLLRSLTPFLPGERTPCPSNSTLRRASRRPAADPVEPSLLVGLIVVSQIALAPALAQAGRRSGRWNWMGPERSEHGGDLSFAPTEQPGRSPRAALSGLEAEAGGWSPFDFSRGSSRVKSRSGAGANRPGDDAASAGSCSVCGRRPGRRIAEGERLDQLVALDAPQAPRRIAVPVDPSSFPTRYDG